MLLVHSMLIRYLNLQIERALLSSFFFLFVVVQSSILMVVIVFKEAYEEFKHVLLAFIYDKDDKASPVANEVGLNSTFTVCLTRGPLRASSIDVVGVK